MTKGVAVPSIEVALPFQENWYFDTVCAGIEHRAAADGVGVHVVAELPGPAGRGVVAERFHAALAQEGCVGAVAVGFEFKGPQVARLLEHGRTVVVVGGPCEGLPSIFPDDAVVARAATQHLLDLGHRRIAHLAGYALSPDDFTMRSDRVRGYSGAMRDAGLESGSHVVPCEFTHEAAYRAATTMLSAPDRPTAVFAVADELAFAVLDAARDLGLEVPRDLSVIGIDDHPNADARGLTTFHQDARAIGVLAAERVLGASETDRQVVDLALVRRSSTTGPGASTAPKQGNSGLAGLFRRRR